jgi:hypothetical protein
MKSLYKRVLSQIYFCAKPDRFNQRHAEKPVRFIVDTTLVLFSVFTLIFFEGCYYDNFTELHPILTSTVCDTTKVMSFSADIVPVLNNSCGTNNSCHSSSNTSRVDLSTYSGVAAVATNGQLVSSVTWDGSVSNMPQGSSVQISVCDQTKIKKWVAANSPNN